MIKRRSILLSFFFLCEIYFASSDVAAQLPEKCVDVDKIPKVENIVSVTSANNLNALLSSAQPGTEFVLEAGGYWSGEITFPTNSLAAGVEEDWIVIRSGGNLPPQGTRISPADASQMATIELISANSSHNFLAGSKYVRLIGIEFRIAQNLNTDTILRIGIDEGVAEDNLPNHIIIDRCWFHGQQSGNLGTLRGIAMTGDHIAIIDSYFEEFKRSGADSQAIAVWGGNGPHKIVNNYLSAAGQNLWYGGVIPQPSTLAPPSDIEIKYNYFYKPTSWRPGQFDYDGGDWTVRNLLELKFGRKVLVEGNYFQHNWNGAETGMAIEVAASTIDGTYTFAECCNITIRNNLLNGSSGAIQISNTNKSNQYPVRTQKIVFENNLGVDIGANWGRTKFFKLTESGLTDVRIQKNTMYGDNDAAGMEQGTFGRIEVIDNIMTFGDFGWIGTSAGGGSNAMQYYCNSYNFTNNAYRGEDTDFQAWAYEDSFFFSAWSDVLTNPPANEYPEAVTSFTGFDPKNNDGIGANTVPILTYYQYAKSGVRPTQPESKCEKEIGFGLSDGHKSIQLGNQLAVFVVVLMSIFSGYY